MDAVADEFLAHYGVKGMRWGVRRVDPATGKPRQLSDRQKTALKVAGGTAVAVGAATTAYLLTRNGSAKASSVRDIRRALASTSDARGTYGLLTSANSLSNLKANPARNVDAVSAARNLTKAYSIVNRYGKSSYNSIAAEEMAKYDWGKDRR